MILPRNCRIDRLRDYVGGASSLSRQCWRRKSRCLIRRPVGRYRSPRIIIAAHLSGISIIDDRIGRPSKETADGAGTGITRIRAGIITGPVRNNPSEILHAGNVPSDGVVAASAVAAGAGDKPLALSRRRRCAGLGSNIRVFDGLAEPKN